MLHADQVHVIMIKSSYQLTMLLLFSPLVTSDSFATAQTVAHQTTHPWDFPGKNTGAGCHFLLRGIFPTQGSNPHLPCLLCHRQILYHLSYPGPVPGQRAKISLQDCSLLLLQDHNDSQLSIFSKKKGFSFLNVRNS